MAPTQRVSLHPPSSFKKLPYDPFKASDSDGVEEIANAASITLPPIAFALSTYSDIFRTTWKRDGVKIDVAVKVLRFNNMNRGDSYTEDLKRIDNRLGREMYVWRRLKSPRITPLLGFVRSTNPALGGDRPCLISPFRAQGSLRMYLDNHPEADRLKLLGEIAEGLDYLHTFDPPIAHLDIKPENVLISDQGEAELCDFGLSKAMEDVRSGFTSNSKPTGTMPYTAPELLDDVNARSTAVDIYAFAGVMLWTLSGRTPFEGKGPGQMVMSINAGSTPSRIDHEIRGPQEAVDAVWDLMEKCWKKKPEERPNSTEVLEKVKEIIKKLNV